jgi:hypothetical protein
MGGLKQDTGYWALKFRCCNKNGYWILDSLQLFKISSKIELFPVSSIQYPVSSIQYPHRTTTNLLNFLNL